MAIKPPKYCEICGEILGTPSEVALGWCDDCNLPERSCHE